MSEQPRYLTKSRFKLGMECPTKLFYTKKEAEYANSSLEDSFLEALAEGGFQVGELAKQYFPAGHDIQTLDYDQALSETAELLQKKKVVIFEAAIRFNNLFIRADILVKDGRKLDLIEVKSKSYNSQTDGQFVGRRGGLISGWKPYLWDVAFQRHVVRNSYPNSKLRSSLMLVDKKALCPTDGLHQKFQIVQDSDGRKMAVNTSPLTSKELSKPILCKVPVDEVCDQIEVEPLSDGFGPQSFTGRIEWLADHYERDEKIITPISPSCAGCEFRLKRDEVTAGVKSGFHECWKNELGWSDEQVNRPTVMDVWNYRDKDRLFNEGRIQITEITEDDIGLKSNGKPGLSVSERQWMQVSKVQNADDSVWCDTTALLREMQNWSFPLHFIDFETARVAIPFHRGRRPYDVMAFQFSHHLVDSDGNVEHRGQYLNTKIGAFPNYEFVRALKSELDQDKGSIFQYSSFENSILLAIYKQLREETKPPEDRDDLMEFIVSITTSRGSWVGDRTMVDLFDLGKRLYYAPATNGSNSIKALLPAVLNESRYLQEKYCHPIYGADHGISSLNFRNKSWVELDEQGVVDPYHQLPPIFSDVSEHDAIWLKDGGAAMTAYVRMQFEEMEETEREQISAALLRYCELDTLAMVMIYEAWADLVNFPADSQ